MASPRAINQLGNEKIPIFGYSHKGIWVLGDYFPAKSAERRGRSCAGPQTMFDIFFLKRLGHYFRAKSAERRGRSCAGPQKMFDIFF